MTPDEFEESIRIPPDVATPAMSKRDVQDATRGDWPDPRDARQGVPPWPQENDPMLRYLLHKAVASMDAGMPVRDAMLTLAVHAWFEGGVENYDRGRHDGETR